MNPASRDSSRDRQLEAILHPYLQAVDAGQAPDRNALLRQHPEFASELAAFFADQDKVAQLAQGMAQPAASPLADAETPTLAPSTAAVPTPGTHLRYFGDYELLEEIARGGMGVVYKARQVSLDRPVALKMILAGQLAAEADVQRFHAEAQIAANLQHPNIVAIYEVGQHEGQHYFSMALVEGQSLAEMIRDNALPPQRAARYVQIVAEAIQFAHEQGTLHRDLKPSNILIDVFDEPRVTDFGLARRTQVDARLTATGAVLGTPSYLPPEQASGQRGKVGPASDVYSLGAMLYELVTGRPPFLAATPIDTVLLVLSTPPVAPRLLNPQIDRNLETIILKCLAKEPGDRYATARDLAEDLQAYLEGRPIKARRAGPLERSRRWLLKHRRTLGLTAASAALTALLMAGVILAWLRYQPKPEPTGRISLTTSGEPLTAQALDDEDKPLAPPFTVPTAVPQTVPAGCYSFRFTAPGRCNETYRTFVGAEVNAQGHVTLEERRLWEPIPVGQGETADVVALGDHADLILAGAEGIRRIDGASGQQVWKQAFDAKNDDRIAQINQFTRDSGQALWAGNLGTVRLVSQTVDLDSDRVPDLIWANVEGPFSGGPPWILALSGKTGKVLWFYPVRQAQTAKGLPCFALGPPACVMGDGGPVVVLCYRLIETLSNRAQRLQSEKAIWVEALSGGTGTLLWRSALKQWTDANPTFLGAQTVFSEPPVHVLHSGGQELIAAVADNCVGTFDLKTGRVVYRKQELPARVWGIPQFVDGDNPGVLLGLGDSYVCRSLKTGQELWRKSLPPWRWDNQPPGSRPDWLAYRPVVADLGDNGTQAAVLFHFGNANGATMENLGVEVRDAATGETRWRHDFTGRDFRSRYLVRVIVGLDLDGDGQREIFAACLGARPSDPNPTSGVLRVEALSGRDGHALWTYQQPDPNGFHRISDFDFSTKAIAPLRWWQKDAAGWPLLLVSQGPAMSTNDASVFVLSATTGRLVHALPEFGMPGVADLNGDGLPDLYALRGGKIHSLAGQPGEAWRWMQGDWRPVPVRDGGGTELVTPWQNRWLFFISAAAGRLVRRSDLGYVQILRPVAGGVPVDLDGDGVADLLPLGMEQGVMGQWGEFFVQAVSGRTGETLWRSNLRIPQLEYRDHSYPACPDLDGDGRPAVLCIYQTQQQDGNLARYTLAVLSGRDGRLRWQQPLIDGVVWHELPVGPRFVPAIADLDGDGVRDVVVWAVRSDFVHELRAFSGRDGHLLWSQALDSPQEEEARRKIRLKSTGDMVVAVGDLDGDGKPEVIVQRPDLDQQGKESCEILVLEGRDGRRRWSQRLPANPRDDSLTFTPATPFLLSGAGRSQVAVLTVDPTSNEQAQLVVLDHTGKQCGRAPVAIPKRPVGFDWTASVRLLPLDRLLLIGSGKLRLVHGELEDTCWTCPIPEGSGVLVDILSASREKAETIVVEAGTQVLGVDAATGKTLWTCRGPGRCTHALPAAEGLPYLLFQVVDPKNAANVNTVCRRAVAK
jgi:outer membrane protein assembly factor BamB/tRNA A-37 threonylcarbamoyl transferase component Bud32